MSFISRLFFHYHVIYFACVSGQHSYHRSFFPRSICYPFIKSNTGVSIFKHPILPLCQRSIQICRIHSFFLPIFAICLDTTLWRWRSKGVSFSNTWIFTSTLNFHAYLRFFAAYNLLSVQVEFSRVREWRRWPRCLLMRAASKTWLLASMVLGLL